MQARHAPAAGEVHESAPCLRFLFHRLLALLVLANVGGCATPNLHPFAEHTAQMANAIASEQNEVSLKLAQVVALWQEGCDRARQASRTGLQEIGADSCAQHARREGEIKTFEASRKVIDTLLEHTVYYANSLAELTQAGQTGSSAAASLLGTVQKFASLFGAAPQFASATVTSIFTKIADAATNIQAQQSLGEAVWAANGAVTEVADGIEVLYADAYEKIVVALHTDEYEAHLHLTGRFVVQLFQDASMGQNAIGQRIMSGPLRQAFASMRCAGVDATGGDPPKSGAGTSAAECRMLSSELANADEINRLLQQLRPQYDAYLHKRDAALRWHEQRVASHETIRKVAQVWKLEHARLAEELRRCGGLRFHRCLEVNAASVRLLVDRLQEIRSRKGE